MSDAVQLFHGDCLDVLASLPNGSVDAIVSDAFEGQTASEFLKDVRAINEGLQATADEEKEASGHDVTRDD